MSVATTQLRATDARATVLPAPVRHAAAGVRAGLRAYALVLFSQNPWAGLLFVAATMVVPSHGMAGLLGLVMTTGWARLLGRPERTIRSGFYGFNGLLVGLALGLYFRMGLPFVGLMGVLTLLTVIVSSALSNLTERYVGVPVLSLPFVLVTWAAILATRRFAGVEVALDPVLASDWGSGHLPVMAELLLRSLGACFFQLSVLSGALVMAGLLVASRWAAILAAVGFVSGYAVYQGLGGPTGDLTAHFVGFNFILSSIAVGGVFLLLSPGSLAMAVAAGAVTAVLSAALLAFLEPFGLPVLAMPFILTTQLVVFALMTRATAGGLRLVAGTPGTPEQNLRRTVYRDRRYPDPALPAMHLPVMGEWLVTQGPDGPHTHQGLWAHAWDFEVADDEGRRHRGTGEALEDWLAWRAPVVAPADGRVIRVINHLEDTPVGEVDVANNWGNLVILWHHGDVFSAMCHLAKGSATVREGDTVVRGQVLARVGASGRSPVPHLHFQVQGSGDIGAPTRRAALLHYVATPADAARSGGVDVEGRAYMTHGVPDEGCRVQAVRPDEGLRQAASLPPGRTLRWLIREGEQLREETWLSEIDALGGRRLVSDDGRAEAPLYADDSYLTVLDYSGPPDRLLGLFSLAAARVPFLDDPTVPWTDAPSAMAFASPLARMGRELVLPFMLAGAVPTRSHLSWDGLRLHVRTELDLEAAGQAGRGLPARLDLTFETGRGPVALRAWRAGHLVVDAEVMP
ncbi:MAG: urea transporter [Deltaproteobacteria bacterium]|nr:urea transporter [Deltaproteobacteria bacterium]MCB9789143.1 urea transporter [Deltaproteobacteria bacterium]